VTVTVPQGHITYTILEIRYSPFEATI
jgi:hypothetical protein